MHCWIVCSHNCFWICRLCRFYWSCLGLWFSTVFDSGIPESITDGFSVGSLTGFGHQWCLGHTYGNALYWCIHQLKIPFGLKTRLYCGICKLKSFYSLWIKSYYFLSSQTFRITFQDFFLTITFLLFYHYNCFPDFIYLWPYEQIIICYQTFGI